MALFADEPRSDKYRLGLSAEDQRLYAFLRTAERQSFDDELSALANTNSLIRMSRCWDSQKDSPPALEINLGHTAFQKIHQLRWQNLLPIAQMLLHWYYDRHENLIVRFENIKIKNWSLTHRSPKLYISTMMSSSINHLSSNTSQDLISSCNHTSATLNKLLPVKIFGFVIIGLVDSSNSFHNAILLAVAKKIGLTYYHPYKGPLVGTASVGSSLDIVRLIHSTTFSLTNESGKEHKLTSWLVIVKHLYCRLNISLPFLVELGLDQVHSQGVVLMPQ